MGAGEGLGCMANAEQDGCAHVQAGVQRRAQLEGDGMDRATHRRVAWWRCVRGAGLVCCYRDRCMEGQHGDWAQMYMEGGGVHG
jgi:hypothetical protein